MLPIYQFSSAVYGKSIEVLSNPFCYLICVVCIITGDIYFNPFLNKHRFLRVCSTSLLKTLWEKEKLLVTSNNFFSFSHIVFYPFRELSTIFIKFKIVVCKLFEFGRVLNLSFGKGLNLDEMLTLYHLIPTFYDFEGF